MNLTPQEERFLNCLTAVDSNSIWGLAIQKVLGDVSEEKFRALVVQLKSQERDNPQIMREILNEGCYETLLAL